MTIDWVFPRRILATLVVMWCLGWYPLVTYGTPEIISASVVGAILATLNVLIGFASIEYSIGKSTTTFFKFVLGGMGVRLFGLALVLVFLIRVLSMHAAGLVISMGIFYMVFLVLEILFIQKKVNVKHQ
jgi:hypothetical protein